LAESAAVLCEPLAAFEPDHAPAALQAVALVEDHVRVETRPAAIELGLALIVTVGTGAAFGVPVTVTVVEWLADPIGPEHVRANWVVFVSGPIERLPPVETLPLQPPEAVQRVALTVFQKRLAVPPLFNVTGEEVNVIDGAYRDAARAWPLPTAASELSAASPRIDLNAKPNLA
jgi:hypothetical protein